MITLIVDKHAIGENQEVYADLTLKELGETLSALSTDYILVFDTVRNIVPEVSCALYVSVAAKR